MKLFAGLSRTDYQDILRAIGAIVDEKQLRDLRMWEHADGIIVQGRRQGIGEFETISLDDEELQAMLREAYRRRSR
jgi:hypothetical protein